MAAEEVKDLLENTENNQKPADQPDEHNEGEQKAAPTIEELTLQLAKANAEKARFKNSIDKLTHENSELNKWKQERMTAQEQQDEADAEAKRQHEAYVKELEQYKSTNETMQRYLGMNMSAELALATAKAEVSGDMETVMKNIAKHQEEQITAEKAKWLNSRPDIQEQPDEVKKEEEAVNAAFWKSFPGVEHS